MPYTIDNPPDAIKGLPKHAQEIFIAAYNSAFKQYNGDEAKANATAWAAVKTKYEKVGDEWVAKETKEATMVVKTKVKEADMSAEDKRRALEAAIVGQMGHSDDDHIYVEDIWDAEFVYRVNQQSYKASYTMGEGGKIEFGAPEKVSRKTTYEPMEALRDKYNEIVQEAGRRNAVADSKRLKTILQLCQELLSSEGEVDADKIEKATKEADKTLAWLQEQAVTKTEDGVQFPAAAFAYVPDAEKPSTWKLRLWEDPEKKVTRAQLGRAAAALSPGGFRGQKVAIPTEDLPTVKRKIRGEYRKLDVEEDDMPKWVKEAATREMVNSFVPLTEAIMDSKGKAKVIIIQPGFNATKDRYYPKEMLQRDYKVFEGVKMYADHPTPTEDRELPERSIRAWVATLSNVQVDESGVVTGVAEIIEPWLKEKLGLLQEKGLLNNMGISINAVGSATKSKVDGVETTVIEKLIAARSVDFVTEPGAGGVVTFYEADRQHDIDLIGITALRERRPDLVKTIETEATAEIQKEVKHKMEMEETIKENEKTINDLTEENKTLKEAAEKAENEKAIAETKATVDEAVGKADLPDPAKKRVLAQFKESKTADGLEDAIKAEQAYVAELSEAGKVTGMGKTDPPEGEKDKAALRESFKRDHPEWSDKQLDAAVNGR